MQCGVCVVHRAHPTARCCQATARHADHGLLPCPCSSFTGGSSSANSKVVYYVGPSTAVSVKPRTSQHAAGAGPCQQCGTPVHTQATADILHEPDEPACAQCLLVLAPADAP